MNLFVGYRNLSAFVCVCHISELGGPWSSQSISVLQSREYVIASQQVTNIIMSQNRCHPIFSMLYLAWFVLVREGGTGKDLQGGSGLVISAGWEGMEGELIKMLWTRKS